MTDDQEEHVIFRIDPLELIKYLYKEVLVVTIDNKQHRGWVHTIDPVSQSIILVTFVYGQKHLDIVIGHAIKSVSVLNSEVKYKEELDGLFRSDEPVLSKDVCQQRKKILKSWLVKNHIPIDEEDDTGILKISDAVTIHPPYDVNSCISNNEIVLSRLQRLIQSIPVNN